MIFQTPVAAKYCEALNDAPNELYSSVAPHSSEYPHIIGRKCIEQFSR